MPTTRDSALELFEEGLVDGPGAPGLLTIITGVHGSGKSALLAVAGDRARAHGWLTISETAAPGVLGRLGAEMQRHIGEFGTNQRSRPNTDARIAGRTPTTQLPPERQVQWRRLAETLIDLLEPDHAGLLITVDDIQAAGLRELSQLAATIQHLIRARRAVALVMAGLPQGVSDLLTDPAAGFLRRADRIDLGNVPEADVGGTPRTTIHRTGVTDDVPSAGQRARSRRVTDL